MTLEAARHSILMPRIIDNPVRTGAMTNKYFRRLDDCVSVVIHYMQKKFKMEHI